VYLSSWEWASTKSYTLDGGLKPNFLARFQRSMRDTPAQTHHLLSISQYQHIITNYLSHYHIHVLTNCLTTTTPASRHTSKSYIVYNMVQIKTKCICITVDPDIFADINVCKFEFKINFVPEKFAFLKYWPGNSTWCTFTKW